MPGPLRAAATLDGYPQGAFGDRYASCVDHLGPASYTQVTNGTPPTGGDVVQAAEFGLKSLTHVWAAGLSDDAQFEIEVSMGVAARGEPTSAVVVWKVRSTGVQVAGAVALNARSIRLFAIGR